MQTAETKVWKLGKFTFFSGSSNQFRPQQMLSFIEIINIFLFDGYHEGNFMKNQRRIYSPFKTSAIELLFANFFLYKQNVNNRCINLEVSILLACCSRTFFQPDHCELFKAIILTNFFC